jgi:response regulator RpfG family c-di-GMP phosphodiesterase
MIRVLCVDDDPITRGYLVRRLLAEPDIRVVGAVPDVARAMIYLGREQIDVVLLDYLLHGVDGTHLLRGMGSWRSEPGETECQPAVLFCTGFADEGFEAQARLHGARGVVAKDRVAADLISAVRTVARGGFWFGHPCVGSHGADPERGATDRQMGEDEYKPLQVLIVEDCQDDAELLLRELRRGGYAPAFERVDTPGAMSAALDRQTWDLVVADYSLPQFSGLAALALLRERGLDLPFIILSGTIGEETAVAAMKAGAHDFILKGDLARLVPAIERELREAGERRARRQAELDLQRLNVELALAYDTTLEGWSRALDLRDKETEGHSQRVTEMTLRLARAMGMGQSELVHVRRGALLHDIGKMGIPDSILLKPALLTEEQTAIMRRHPVYAYELLSPIDYLRPALDIPHCHHEKWDGTGYPRGLKGEQIPLAARIFAVVDVWDALRSDRPYRPGWSEDRVREHIWTLAGTHFDPKVVTVFLDGGVAAGWEESIDPQELQPVRSAHAASSGVSCRGR